jgi:hypothetical protein
VDVVEQRLTELGLALPPQAALPSGVTIPFHWIRVWGDRLHVSGHGALTGSGQPAGPFGRVPDAVPIEAAQQSAVQAVLSILSSLRRTLGGLDRLAWLSLTCFVSAEPGFAQATLIPNPASELIVELFGPERGAHARAAPGVSALPFDLPVVIAAELVITDRATG